MGVFVPNATNEQCKKFEQYLTLLLKWNKTHNLTAIRDADGMVKRHFLESVALIPHLGTPRTVLDLGTGAGFPGLPIAIMRPDWQVTVLDSAQKKITFCQEVVRICGLNNVTCVLADATKISTQNKSQNKLGRFGAVVSRATWSMSDYLITALPYVQTPNGFIIAIKGTRYREELTQVPALPVNIHGPEVRALSTDGNLSNKLVVIKYWTE